MYCGRTTCGGAFAAGVGGGGLLPSLLVQTFRSVAPSQTGYIAPRYVPCLWVELVTLCVLANIELVVALLVKRCVVSAAAPSSSLRLFILRCFLPAFCRRIATHTHYPYFLLTPCMIFCYVPIQRISCQRIQVYAPGVVYIALAAIFVPCPDPVCFIVFPGAVQDAG
jgi:hypothetical protein